MLRRVVILADDSAQWKIAGLRQLDRVALEVKELAAARGEIVKFIISWSSDIPREKRFLPRHPRLTRLDFVEASPERTDLFLSTRIFLRRKSPLVASLLATITTDGPQTADEIRAAWRNSEGLEGWEYLDDPAQIAACEKRFLRGSSKPQDGLVSRLINRPVSRVITRVLLRTAITPSGWTLAIFILPLAGAGFLARGDYGSVVAGLFLFQLYSIVDGCDGEIARAKYLESERGAKLDTLCDLVGNLLLVVSLGYGLSRSVEGIVVALLIATNELLLGLPARGADEASSNKGDGALYPRHRRLVERSGLLFFGERLAGWLIQLTKRDVALLAFFFLALAGRPAWILHLLGAVAAGCSLLALRSFFSR
ncbi:MAG: CDP-alcohol phosphatidyltransferase family protein [Chthoniobacterales bacterium]|nr:CDP-alcohol phosphatidyltransferase family protein [Chthoniobacterales bacterium]